MTQTIETPETLTETSKLHARAAVVLFDAADVIEHRGWCRGDLYDYRGHVCLVGSVFTAQYATPYPLDLARDFVLERTVRDALRESTGAELLPVWNDAQRDRRKVVRALRRAARLEASRA